MIWVEVLGRHRDVVARHRCAEGEIRIGRGYDNDVVLDDPYVAPRHLRVTRDAAGLIVAEDLGSANGLFLDRGRTRLARATLDGTQAIRIGHTWLRIRTAGHPVAPERIAAPPTRGLPLLLALAAALLALETALIWLGDTSELKASHYLLPLAGLGTLAIGWTAGWSVLSRIFSGHARFGRNLLITLIALLVLSLSGELVALLAFAFTWHGLTGYGYAGLWLFLAALCFFHWREISPTRLPLKAGGVLACAVLAIAVQTVVQGELRANSDQPYFVRRLLPPSFRLSPVVGEDAFFTGVETLKQKLDRDRAKDPAGEPD
jgi:Inner membrane component of T3SS, cytoplasmic domain